MIVALHKVLVWKSAAMGASWPVSPKNVLGYVCELYQAPTAELLLDVLAIVQAREAVGLIAAEVGCSLKDEVLPEMESDVSGWRQAVVEMGEALACGSQALADGRFDAAERVAVSKELGDVIRAASALKRKLSGAR